MVPIIAERFSQMSRWATVIVLSCTAVFAQDSTRILAQKPTASPAQNDNSQLPDEPGPGRVSSSGQTSENAQPQSSSATTQTSISTDPKTQVTVLENTLIRVMTNAPLSSRQTREGAHLLFTLSEDVVVDNLLIIPRGATVHGTAVQSRKAGTLTGSPDLILKLVSLDLGGRSYPLYSYQFKVEGTSKDQADREQGQGRRVDRCTRRGRLQWKRKGRDHCGG